MDPAENSLPRAGITFNLGDEDRQALASYGSFDFLPAEKALIKQGQPHGRLFCVLGGRFEARRELDGSHLLLGSIEPGEWIGEVDIFSPNAAICSVVAAEPSRYWTITREKFEEFINENKNAAIIVLIGLASTLGTRIRGITEQLATQARTRKTGAESPEDPRAYDDEIRSASDLAAAFLRQRDEERLKKRGV
jgi:CRP-like cAMP-binding protein